MEKVWEGVAGFRLSCKPAKEPLDSAKSFKFLDYLGNYKLLKNKSATWNYLLMQCQPFY
jgi:hypothetical protein